MQIVSARDFRSNQGNIATNTFICSAKPIAEEEGL